MPYKNKEDQEKCQQQWYWEHKEEKRIYNREWRQRNKEARRAYNAEWRRSNKEYGREYRLQEYSLTKTDFDVMFDKQHGACAICKKTKALHIDHDHRTGRVRSLLCVRCNTALGAIEGDLYNSYLAYIEAFR